MRRGLEVAGIGRSRRRTVRTSKAANSVVVRLRSWSSVIGPARPGLIGSDGWVRSTAWIWLFSSMHSTIAFSGGLRYTPTTSTSFSSKSGSPESLNVRTRCGCRSRADQIRCTVEEDTPARSAIVRHDQCVSLAGSRSASSARSPRSWRAGIEGLRPRSGRTAEKSFRPASSNRSRHDVTAAGETCTSAAIRAFANPSPAINSTRARCTSRRGAVRCAKESASPASKRCASVTGSAGVAARIPHPYQSPHICGTRRWLDPRPLTRTRAARSQAGRRSSQSCLCPQPRSATGRTR